MALQLAPDKVESDVDLLARIHALSEQVKGLVNAEKALYDSQQQLDAQVRVYRQLYEVGKRLNASLDVDNVARIIVQFVVYELYFERCVVLLKTNSGFRVAAHEGYYNEADASALETLELPTGSPVASVLDTYTNGFSKTEPSEGSPFAALAVALRLDELTGLPIAAGPDGVRGFVVAGNRAEKWEYHTRVADEAKFALGFANLVSQSGTALSTVEAYAALNQERNALEEKVRERTRELSTAMESLKALDKLKTNFFSNVSHELRTPLTLSIGPIEMLLRPGTALDAESRSVLTSVHANQLRLLKLINDLLDFSKMEEGKHSLRVVPIPLVQTVRYYLSTLQAAADVRRIELLLNVPEDDDVLYADANMLEKIVMNLLSNAFKFTPNGGKITLDVQFDTARVVVAVTDTGIGIPEDKREVIFQRFSQVDSGENRQYEGTGIGLAMVKEYMALHGGVVSVESAVGSGSKFTLAFKRGSAHFDPRDIADQHVEVAAPKAHNVVDIWETARSESIAPPALSSPPDAVPAAPPTAAAPDARRPTVLVVDDNHDLRRYISSVLSEHFEVHVAKDGAAGLESARALVPDLVISDVMMPRMSGYELCRAMKQDASDLARVPVILLTAKAERSMRLEGLQCGADDYLIKPFDCDELLARARNLITLRAQENALAAAHRQLVAHSEVIARDLRQARAFQRSLLPTEPSPDRLITSTVYEPCAVVGGDIYDIVEVRSGVFRLFIADAAGHGVQASLRTILLRNEYDGIKRHAPSPQAAIVALNDRLTRLDADVVMHFTCACVDVLPRADGTLDVTYANAGHVPLFVAGANGVREVLARGPLLGFSPDITVDELEFRVDRDETLILTSDGMLEERGLDGEEFGGEPFLRALVEARSRGGRIASDLLEALKRFAASSPLTDDVTIVSVQAPAARTVE